MYAIHVILIICMQTCIKKRFFKLLMYVYMIVLIFSDLFILFMLHNMKILK